MLGEMGRVGVISHLFMSKTVHTYLCFKNTQQSIINMPSKEIISARKKTHETQTESEKSLNNMQTPWKREDSRSHKGVE